MKHLWLKGGGFLDITFLLPNTGKKFYLTPYIYSEFLEMGFLPNLENFEKFVEEDLMRFSFQYKIAGERLCNLTLHEISETWTGVHLYFYEGDGIDFEEPYQKSIQRNEHILFVDLFKKIHQKFQFSIGTIGVEVDYADLFEFNFKIENHTENDLLQKIQTKGLIFSGTTCYFWAILLHESNDAKTTLITAQGNEVL